MVTNGLYELYVPTLGDKNRHEFSCYNQIHNFSLTPNGREKEVAKADRKKRRRRARNRYLTAKGS